MKRTALSVPEIAIIAGTRAALGAGVALLVSERLKPEQRRAAGWTLLLFGAVTTLPILMQLRGSAWDAGSGEDEDGETGGGE